MMLNKKNGCSALWRATKKKQNKITKKRDEKRRRKNGKRNTVFPEISAHALLKLKIFYKNIILSTALFSLAKWERAHQRGKGR